MQAGNDHPQQALLNILTRLLLKFCLKHAISFKSVSLTIKKCFLELAAEELERKGQKATLSRLHIMTGIDRREVTRIRRDESTDNYTPHPARKVLNQWEQDKRFHTKSGRPRTLSYKSEGNEFNQLVAAVSGNLNPAAMLAELKRMGAVIVTKNGVKLGGKKGSINYIDPDRQLGVLARNLEVLTSAAEANLTLPVSERYLNIRTEYDNLYSDDLQQIKLQVRKAGGSFHKKLRNLFFKHDQDLTPQPGKTAGARAVVCSFAWLEDGDHNNE